MVSLRSHLAVLGRHDPPEPSPLNHRSPTARHRLALALALVLATSLNRSHASDPAPLVETWLNQQTNVHTWSAEVIQTRALKSLLHPLTATGRVWFAAPHQFRWELGDPPQTIAVRQPERMLVIYPRLKRVELFPLDAASPGPWRDALALLEAGFPRSRSELESRFRLLDVSATQDLHTLSLQPRSASARRLMPLIRVGFGPTDYQLRFTEIQFADGSSMRNDFRQIQVNPALPEDLFEPRLEPDWEVVRPKSK